MKISEEQSLKQKTASEQEEEDLKRALEMSKLEYGYAAGQISDDESPNTQQVKEILTKLIKIKRKLIELLLKLNEFLRFQFQVFADEASNFEDEQQQPQDLNMSVDSINDIFGGGDEEEVSKIAQCLKKLSLK